MLKVRISTWTCIIATRDKMMRKSSSGWQEFISLTGLCQYLFWEKMKHGLRFAGMLLAVQHFVSVWVWTDVGGAAVRRNHAAPSFPTDTCLPWLITKIAARVDWCDNHVSAVLALRRNIRKKDSNLVWTGKEFAPIKVGFRVLSYTRNSFAGFVANREGNQTSGSQRDIFPSR